MQQELITSCRITSLSFDSFTKSQVAYLKSIVNWDPMSKLTNFSGSISVFSKEIEGF
jgi:hypothetical protein